jgi:DNA replication protein DnaC
MALPEAWAVILDLKRSPLSNANAYGRSAQVARMLSGIEKTVFSNSVKCPRCGDELSALPPEGLCCPCLEFRDHEILLSGRVEKILGKWASGRFTLENFQTPTDGHIKVKGIAVRFRPEKDSLFIHGPCGSGKSHIAAALLQEWCSTLRGSVGFERTSHLMRMIRGMKGYEEAAYIEALAAKKLLVIDDLGVGRGTEFTLSVLYEIIEERTHRGRSGLIITSNLTLDQIATKFGDDRLTSRISGMCQTVSMDFPDWRSKDTFSESYHEKCD